MQAEVIIVELSGVRVTHDAIQELDDDRPVVVIPRRDVAAVRLRQGYVAERPLVLMVLGVVLTGFGIVMGVSLIRHALDPGSIGRGSAHVLASFAMTIGLGAWAMHRALRKGTLVEVVLRSDRRKLAFRGHVTPEATAAFLRALHESSVWARLVV